MHFLRSSRSTEVDELINMAELIDRESVEAYGEKAASLIEITRESVADCKRFLRDIRVAYLDYIVPIYDVYSREDGSVVIDFMFASGIVYGSAIFNCQGSFGFTLPHDGKANTFKNLGGSANVGSFIHSLERDLRTYPVEEFIMEGEEVECTPYKYYVSEYLFSNGDYTDLLDIVSIRRFTEGYYICTEGGYVFWQTNERGLFLSKEDAISYLDEVIKDQWRIEHSNTFNH